MRIYIKDKNETREITLRVWDNRYNNGWSPDCFGDLASDLPSAFPTSGIDTDAEAAMTDAEYRETVEWWENEVAAYNSRERNNFFVENLTDEEINEEYAKDLEYSLFLDCRLKR